MSSYFEDIGAWPSSVSWFTYTLGFAASVLLTLTCYILATHAMFGRQTLMILLLALAGLQFALQSLCFLHLGGRSASPDRLMVLSASLLIVLILTSGSLWIMFTLNGRMMPSAAGMEQYMNDQQGI